jgi:multidrug efflux pump subunit AcrB
MNISAIFIHRPIATTLLMTGLALLGLVAYPIIPIVGVPQVDIPTIQVVARLPGASAETMATSVAAPLERQLALIDVGHCRACSNADDVWPIAQANRSTGASRLVWVRFGTCV